MPYSWSDERERDARGIMAIGTAGGPAVRVIDAWRGVRVAGRLRRRPTRKSQRRATLKAGDCRPRGRPETSHYWAGAAVGRRAHSQGLEMVSAPFVADLSDG